jgi:CopG family nickel-responsive transcriptional regulator
MLQASEELDKSRDCLATLTYIYDHASRDLPRRLTQTFHDHHELSLASLHVHLDHDHCLEVTVLRGKSADVRHFADHVISERGVRYGKLAVMPAAKAGKKKHSHSH